VAGWEPSGEAQSFESENLFDLVNGQADAFFAYAFQAVAVREYVHPDGGTVRIEVWKLQTPADAYGLFTTFRAGTPLPLGNEGDTDAGRRLDFWQDRYLVRLFAPQPVPEDDLRALGKAVSNALPTGGEVPALVNRLPSEGLLQRNTLYFHQEISIQDDVWLGGQNILELSPETEGVLARYEMGDEKLLVLLVRYPDASVASTALGALRSSGLDELVAAEARDELLAAAFGAGSGAEAETLLDQILNP
jgi:hypothetical protein